MKKLFFFTKLDSLKKVLNIFNKIIKFFIKILKYC